MDHITVASITLQKFVETDGDLWQVTRVQGDKAVVVTCFCVG